VFAHIKRAITRMQGRAIMHDDPNEMNMAAYGRSLTYRKRSPNTISSYMWWITDLARWLDGADVTAAVKADLEDYFVHRFEGMADRSAGVAFRSLRAFYNWTVDEEIIEKSPMAKMHEPSVEDRPPPVVADEDLILVFKACAAGKRFEDRRDLAILRMLNEPGTPRRAEMASILLEHLDMRANKVTFRGKGAVWRTIYLGVKTGQALDRYLRMRAKHPLAALPQLWLGQHGKPLTDWGIGQMVQRRCVQAGVKPFTPHQMRHTTYHAWKLAGGSEEDAEALWGWSEGSRMPRHYGRSEKLTRAERASRRMSLGERI
jgi:site-specific recombinase XerD